MRSKKGFADPYTIAIVAGIIIFVLILGWYNTSSESKKQIDAEKQKNTQLANKLYETQTDLGEANKIIKNQSSQINQLIIELNQYKNSYEYFPLFWLKDIKLTKSLVIIINISLALFSFSLFKIIIRFGKKR